MYILAIESSCDETAVALYHEETGLVRHEIASQIELQSQYGGVVPELASRDHIKKLPTLVSNVMKDIPASEISCIAYTKGPGLIGALMVGSVYAKTLAFAYNVPAVAVHHMEGHLLAPMLEEERPDFPFLALLVSGGHTQLIRVNELGNYELLGETLDDAAGEAFDKTAKMLGLGYPGGPIIEQLAKKGITRKYIFPRPLTKQPGLDFSFSGLKTFALNTYNKSNKSEQCKADIALAFQEAVIDTFLIKCKRALKETKLKTLVLAGGVSANKKLRAAFDNFAAEEGIKIFYPRIQFCTDNAAMIAYAGYCRLRNLGHKDKDLSIIPKPRWALSSINNEYI